MIQEGKRCSLIVFIQKLASDLLPPIQVWIIFLSIGSLLSEKTTLSKMKQFSSKYTQFTKNSDRNDDGSMKFREKMSLPKKERGSEKRERERKRKLQFVARIELEQTEGVYP